MDLLDSVEKNIHTLEKKPGNRQLIDDAFGIINTIKGNAGFLGFGEMEDTCMRMESIMDSIRDGGMEASVKTATALLETLESLRVMLDVLRSGEGETDTSDGSNPYKPIPILCKASLILVYPHEWLSFAISTRSAILSRVRGRPGPRLTFLSYFLATRLQNQRNNVSGVTIDANCSRALRPRALTLMPSRASACP